MRPSPSTRPRDIGIHPKRDKWSRFAFLPVALEARCARALSGKDLPVFFDNIFRRESRFCVIFVSTAYADGMWTQHERRSAVARMMNERAVNTSCQSKSTMPNSRVSRLLSGTSRSTTTQSTRSLRCWQKSCDEYAGLSTELTNSVVGVRDRHCKNLQAGQRWTAQAGLNLAIMRDSRPRFSGAGCDRLLLLQA